ncbi:hypothetical protein ACJBSD_10215, partial [Streptococcus suis]
MPGILSSVRIGLVALFAGVLTFSTASAEAAKNEIRIGTDGSDRPWSGTNAAGELEGFDIELATAACSEMQRKC